MPSDSELGTCGGGVPVGLIDQSRARGRLHQFFIWVGSLGGRGITLLGYWASRMGRESVPGHLDVGSMLGRLVIVSVCLFFPYIYVICTIYMNYFHKINGYSSEYP